MPNIYGEEPTNPHYHSDHTNILIDIVIERVTGNESGFANTPTGWGIFLNHHGQSNLAGFYATQQQATAQAEYIVAKARRGQLTIDCRSPERAAKWKAEVIATKHLAI